jgi:diguanylate cyclase (GGDEF)-like protein
LQRDLRGQDVLSRWGGEEFLLLLPETDLAGATVVAEKLRVSLESQPIDFEGHRVRVTASMGVSVFTARSTAEECVRIADECLYQAKFLGRNRVVAAGQSDGKSPVG